MKDDNNHHILKKGILKKTSYENYIFYIMRFRNCITLLQFDQF